MLKLYYSPGACSLAPHIALKETGQTFATELVSSMDGSTKTTHYLTINPKGRVPALAIGNTIITEVSAILTYLALTYPQANLLDNTPIGLARTTEWMSWLNSIHASVIAQIWRVERFSDNPSMHKNIQTTGMENLLSFCDLVEAKLSATQWATGDNYSIVDPYLLVFYRWGNRLDLNMEKYTNWTRHAQQMAQRKAVQEVLQVENITLWQ